MFIQWVIESMIIIQILNKDKKVNAKSKQLNALPPKAEGWNPSASTNIIKEHLSKPCHQMWWAILPRHQNTTTHSKYDHLSISTSNGDVLMKGQSVSDENCSRNMTKITSPRAIQSTEHESKITWRVKNMNGAYDLGKEFFHTFIWKNEKNSKYFFEKNGQTHYEKIE